jgi:lipid-A-disaccharide synthase
MPYRFFTHNRFYCLINILGSKEIFPELIDKNIRVDSLYQELKKIHHNEAIRVKVVNGCQEVRQLLGKTAVHQRTAQAIVELVAC